MARPPRLIGPSRYEKGILLPQLPFPFTSQRLGWGQNVTGNVLYLTCNPAFLSFPLCTFFVLFAYIQSAVDSRL